MESELKLARDVPLSECPWLDEPMEAGTQVFRYTGHTYGCIGPDGIACTAAPDELPFFELPADALIAALETK